MKYVLKLSLLASLLMVCFVGCSGEAPIAPKVQGPVDPNLKPASRGAPGAEAAGSSTSAPPVTAE